MPPQQGPRATLPNDASSLSEPLLPPDEECLPSEQETVASAREQPVSRNVTIVLLYTFFSFAGRSIWNQNVLATFCFLLRDGDPKSVGYMTAAMGLAQLLVSFPAGFLADKYRRDAMLKGASLIGVAAVATTIVALHYSSYPFLVGALCVWGFFYGVANPSITALFADSIPDGQRAQYFTTRSVLINLGNVAGPIVALVMFASLGDKWTIKDCSTVMIVGQSICMPSIFLLCLLNDDDACVLEDEQVPLLEAALADEGSNFAPQEEPQSNQRPDTQHQDETYDQHRLGRVFWYLPKERIIPCLVATADVTAGLASGMSIRYFAIFLYDNLHIDPASVQVLYILCPLIQASLMKIAQYLAKTWGRCRIAVAFKWIGISLMVAMVASYTQGFPIWLTCVILVFRTAFMNSTSALTKSVLMDHVPKEERAKWGALESLNMFSWSGSAAIGGILVDYRGIVFNFCVTACLQFIATMPFLVLSFFGETQRDVEQEEEDDESEQSIQI
jgi:MFS family permease